MASDQAAFVICQIGSPGSETRARTNELCDFVLKPPLDERGLRLARADEDPTPGTVSVQIIQSIVRARVVIADLTGRNPNVYYELGVAHSFAKPVIILVDSPRSLAFDLQGERAIPIGDDGNEIGARKAAAAADAVRRQLDVVLADDYTPQSLVRGAGVAASLERFASDDPVKAQLVHISEQVESLRREAMARRIEPNAPLGTGPAVTADTLIRFSERLGGGIDDTRAIGMLGELSPLERRALILYWGLDGVANRTSFEVAEELGVSVGRTRDVISSAAAVVGRLRERDEPEPPADEKKT